MYKTISINRNNHFKRIYKRGKSFAQKFLVLYVSKNNVDINRLGITISKKVGKAVVRNRVRRIIKENYRLLEKQIPTGYDVIFVSKVRANEANFFDIQKAMKSLLSQANLLMSGEELK